MNRKRAVMGIGVAVCFTTGMIFGGFAVTSKNKNISDEERNTQRAWERL